MKGPAILLLAAAACPGLDGTLTPRPLGSEEGCPYGFLEYLPADYAGGTAPAALVVSFHGRGGEGDGAADLAKLGANGPARLIGAGRDLPAIVLCPQATTWYDVPVTDRFIAWARRHYRVDARRIYLIGHSAGGSQVWNYAHAHPDVPAAIVPICGNSDPANARAPKDPARLAALPVWAFHCFDDGTVKRDLTIRWMEGLDRTGPGLMEGYPGPAGGDASAQPAGAAWAWSAGVGPGGGSPSHAVTFYATGGHDAWTRTYANAALWTWLFAQHRPETGR
jgi:poly(3-hydroxybutyrate) depolymerase